MQRFATPLRCYQALSALTLCVILADLAVILFWGLRPTDVGGTLFGGSFNQVMYLMAWAALLGGLLVCSLMRLPGHWLGWGAAGVLQTGIGLWWLIVYPASGNPAADDRIFVPTQDDITHAMMLGMGMIALAAWRARLPRKAISPGTIGPKSVMALALIIVCVAVPMRAWLSEPIPYCSFDKEGNQLSICLGDEPRNIL
ncbi:hypothetical protein [Pseudomonas putida]